MEHVNCLLLQEMCPLLRLCVWWVNQAHLHWLKYLKHSHIFVPVCCVNIKQNITLFKISVVGLYSKSISFQIFLLVQSQICGKMDHLKMANSLEMIRAGSYVGMTQAAGRMSAWLCWGSQRKLEMRVWPLKRVLSYALRNSLWYLKGLRLCCGKHTVKTFRLQYVCIDT